MAFNFVDSTTKSNSSDGQLCLPPNMVNSKRHSSNFGTDDVLLPPNWWYRICLDKDRSSSCTNSTHASAHRDSGQIPFRWSGKLNVLTHRHTGIVEIIWTVSIERRVERHCRSIYRQNQRCNSAKDKKQFHSTTKYEFRALFMLTLQKGCGLSRHCKEYKLKSTLSNNVFKVVAIFTCPRTLAANGRDR